MNEFENSNSNNSLDKVEGLTNPTNEPAASQKQPIRSYDFNGRTNDSIDFDNSEPVQEAPASEGITNQEISDPIETPQAPESQPIAEADSSEAAISGEAQAPSEAISNSVEDIAPRPKKKSKFKRNVAIGLAGVILGAFSIGFGYSAGYNVASDYIQKHTTPFSLSSRTDEGTDATLTSVLVPENENDVANVIKSVKDSVVNIAITAQTSSFFFQSYETTGAGSGIIYSQDEEKVYIVTNCHVVEGASTVKISIADGTQVNAKLVGKDATSDLAVISVLKSDLTLAGINEVSVATFGSSENAEVGEFVFAIGNALGQGKTATRGIISATNKEVSIDGNTMTVIQTDAAINPGNSGGALVNASGEVIGINTAKLASYEIESTGYAIPSDLAKNIIEQLMENGTVTKPYLGISGFEITDTFKMMYNIDTNGIFIQTVEENSSAARAGLQYSDIITKIDGQEIKSLSDLSNVLTKHKVGDSVTITFIRNGYQEMTATTTLDNLNENF